ncbi:MAG: sulfurtransferase [Nitrospinota bacterium]|nr:MAG: sulfurtransferase [Nitrospinota bacterium]
MPRVAITFISILFLSITGLARAQMTGKVGDPNRYENPQLLITAEELHARLEEPRLRIIDVRSQDAYAQGHIPGAVNLPIGQITVTRNGIPGMLAPQEVVEESLGAVGVTPESRVVIYDEAGGDRATRLFWVLDYYGHPHMAVLDGGFAAWQAAAFPITTAVPAVPKTTYRGTPDPAKLATGEWIRDHLTDPAVVLVDARSRAEFRGKVAGRGVKIAGHIPGAVNIDWVRNLTETAPRKILPPTTLRRLYAEVGISQDKTVVVYCRSGMRASHTYFVLRLLGYPRVRLYDGSWLEWANSGKFPLQHQCRLDNTLRTRQG